MEIYTLKIERKDSHYFLTSCIDLCENLRFEEVLDLHIHHLGFAIFDDDILIFCGNSYYGIRSFFASTYLLEFYHHSRKDCEHISFLRFIGPYFPRTHRVIIDWYGTKIKYCPDTAAMCKFGKSISDTTSSYIMDRDDRIIGS